MTFPFRVLALCALLLSVAAAQTPKDVKPTVEFARTWEAAVEEAKIFNQPIVLHSHGFY